MWVEKFHGWHVCRLTAQCQPEVEPDATRGKRHRPTMKVPDALVLFHERRRNQTVDYSELYLFGDRLKVFCC
jgi:hypothetical protein